MITYNDTQAIIYNRQDESAWFGLCDKLDTQKLEFVYFHYTDYKQSDKHDLYSSLARSSIKKLWVKDSTFDANIINNGESEWYDCGLTRILQSGLTELEELVIRNFENSGLDRSLPALAELLTSNSNLKKIEFEQQNFSGENFAVFCQALEKRSHSIQLTFHHLSVTFSDDNIRLLKQVIKSNDNVTVDSNTAKLIDSVDSSVIASASRGGASSSSSFEKEKAKEKQDTKPNTWLLDGVTAYKTGKQLLESGDNKSAKIQFSVAKTFFKQCADDEIAISKLEKCKRQLNK